MNCSPFDVRDYFLGELAPADRREVELHISKCAACSEEMESLRLLRTAIKTVPEEEPPRRIAFVSDKVFEPGWWQAVWNSGPKLGFVSAALLAAAIFVHGWAGPSEAGPAIAKIDEARLEAEMERRVDAAVQKAVSGIESRYDVKLREAVARHQRRLEFEHRANLVSLQEYAEVLEKRMLNYQRASYEMPGAIR